MRRAAFRVLFALLGVPLLIISATSIARADDTSVAWSAPATLRPPTPNFIDSSVYQTKVVSLPDGTSVALWGDYMTLYASERPLYGTTWSAPHAITTDGAFTYPTFPYGEFSVAVTSVGDVVVAWANDLSTAFVESATRDFRTGAWSAVQTLLRGPNAEFNDGVENARVAVGPNGEAAVVWSTTVNVYVSRRLTFDSAWSAPELVSDAVPTGGSAFQDNAQAAFDSRGDLVVIWEAYDASLYPSTLPYRPRSRTWNASTGSWTDPVWLNSAGHGSEQLTLVPGQANVLASWIDVVSGSTNGSDVVSASTSGFDVALTTGDGAWSASSQAPAQLNYGGVITAVSGGRFLILGAQPVLTGYGPMESAVISPDGSWGSITDLTSGGSSSPSISIDSGTRTAWWQDYTSANTWQMYYVQPSPDGSSWTAPKVQTFGGSSVSYASVTTSVQGETTIIYDQDDRARLLSNEGENALLAVHTLDPTAPPPAPAPPPIATPPPAPTPTPAALPSLQLRQAPRIIGALTVGTTLTAGGDVWNVQPQQRLYQWMRNGVEIIRATKPSYVVTLQDAGQQLSVTEIAQTQRMNPGRATSAPVRIAIPHLTNTRRPTITGPARVRAVVTAHPGTWSPASTNLSYRWYRNGHLIATGARYRITAHDRNTKLTVRVTAASTDYTPATATSNPLVIR